MHVGFASEDQHESLVELLCELHGFYNEGAAVPPALVREHLLENLLGPASPHRLVTAARPDGQVLGLAAVSMVFSIVEPEPDKRRHCQLKELYVRSAARSLGVGRALMGWVARHAWDHGCRRIDWPVKASNLRGQAFYESLGAQRVAERLSYRLSGPAMDRLARAGGAAPAHEQARRP